MKSKTFWFLVIACIIFASMFLFLEFHYAEYIDAYGKNIQNFFGLKTFQTIFLVITNIMSMIGILVILVLTMYFLRQKDAKREIILYILSIFICFISTNLIKIIVRRERPLEQLLEVGGFSFPSSHSSISLVVYGYIILLIRRYYHGKWKNLYIMLCLALILLTGISRIYFNVHYVTDVLAGYSVGLIVLCGSNFTLKKLTK